MTVELVARGRSWPCRLLRHRACHIAYPSPLAVAYVGPTGPVAITGWLRCPCRCHGDLPSPECHPLAEESA